MVVLRRLAHDRLHIKFYSEDTVILSQKRSNNELWLDCRHWQFYVFFMFASTFCVFYVHIFFVQNPSVRKLNGEPITISRLSVKYKLKDT